MKSTYERSIKYLYDRMPKKKVQVNTQFIYGFYSNRNTMDSGRNLENQLYGVNSIYFFTNTKVPVGCVLQDGDAKFLVLHVEFDSNAVYYKLFLQEMNYIIKTDKGSNTIVKVQGILDTHTFNIKHENTHSTLTNFFTFTCPKNDYTYSMDYNTKIIALRNLYRIIGIDTKSNGLIIFTCEKMQRENIYDYAEVFDFSSNPDTPTPHPPQEPPISNDRYSIKIAGKNSLFVGQTSTYTTTVYKNENEIVNKAVLWSLDNDKGSILEQTDKICKFKTLQIGNCTLKATLSDHSDVSADFKITIRRL